LSVCVSQNARWPEGTTRRGMVLEGRMETMTMPVRSGANRDIVNAKTKSLQVEWWSWGDLNPRPQAFFAQIYMFSDLF
jgi:hypothetical protein